MMPLTDQERLDALEAADIDKEQRLEGLERAVNPLATQMSHLVEAIERQTDRLDKWSLAISGGAVTIIAVLLAKVLA